MKKNKLVFLGGFAFATFLGFSSPVRAQDKPKSDTATVKKKVKTEGEEENRNVMLNASNATGPRQVPIGIPGLSIDVTVDEDHLPVDYSFWPNLPTLHFRDDASLSSIGLYNIAESGILYGTVGYAVSSNSMLGGDKFSGKVNYTTNHFGSQKVDMNLNGPIGNGWSLSASMLQYSDPGAMQINYADLLQRTSKFKFALTKYFNNKKGSISFLFKHVHDKDLGSFMGYTYAPFIYNGDGSISKLPGFKLGTSSSVQQNGKVQYLDLRTAKYDTVSLNDDQISGSKANEFTSLFNYKFDNGLNLMINARYQHSNTNMGLQEPLAITQNATGFMTLDGQSYSGNVQTSLSLLDHGIINDFFFTTELTKKSAHHNWRLGFAEKYSHVKWTGNSTYYYQEAQANPYLLSYNGTTFFSYNMASEAYTGYENGLSAYFTDTWDITKRLSLTYGLRAEWQRLDLNNLPVERYSGLAIGNTDPSTGVVTEFTHSSLNLFNPVATISAVYKVTNPFGFLAELDYNMQHNHMEAYAGDNPLTQSNMPITMGRLGVYYNNPYFSLVSAATIIRKNNNHDIKYLVDPDNSDNTQTYQAYYDVQTIGWTTDGMITPTKNFSMHLLLTLQKPVYKKYVISAFDKTYNFNNKIVTGLSQVLMEIDPRYSISKKIQIWTSFRYFGKQYANLSNILYFNGHWETFGGVNYSVNKFLDLGVDAVNFLNQTGVTGTISGSDLMTDASKYKNYMMSGTVIRPFTLEAKATVRF